MQQRPLVIGDLEWARATMMARRIRGDSGLVQIHSIVSDSDREDFIALYGFLRATR